MLVQSFSTLASLSDAAAQKISELAKEAIAERGKFSIALSGGETPRVLYEALARDYQSAVDWNHVYLFFGDERYVPHDDPASNYKMAKDALIDLIEIPTENVHPINTSFASPEESADDYSEEIISSIGGPIPSFDLILLGLGGDGHTASLFPGMDFGGIAGKLVAVTSSPILPKIRISLTLDVINVARNVLFLAAGSGKKGILREVLDDSEKANPHFPAAMVRPNGNLIWFVDEAAIGR